jgi:hypothetical protein
VQVSHGVFVCVLCCPALLACAPATKSAGLVLSAPHELLGLRLTTCWPCVCAATTQRHAAGHHRVPAGGRVRQQAARGGWRARPCRPAAAPRAPHAP